MKRSSGVLLHISSLPNDFGIGSFGQSAYDFVDFLVESEQSYWQILPLTTTSYGDSPYQSFSAFAGNTHFIDFELLAEAGLLEKADYENIPFSRNPESVDYARIFNLRRPVLEKAVQRFIERGDFSDYETFHQENHDWLEPFVEYMTVKEDHELKPWYEWPEALRYRHHDALEVYHRDYQPQLNYHRVTQYFFAKQWQAIKNYANRKEIQIIGDLPIYVARDSVEMWTQPELFKVDETKTPTNIAGTPPDNFTEDGQFWGNPIYDWNYMAEQEYAWWKHRIVESFKLYDVLRFDHFRGFESYWDVPYGAETAAEGDWTKGPGLSFFQNIEASLGELSIIAEDLGFMTDAVIEMREATGYPGMKILQFGFTGKGDSLDLPHHYKENTVAYVGTHDNETALGWYKDSASPEQREQLRKYLNLSLTDNIPAAMNRAIAASVSRLAIYTMQDLLGLDNRARMNEPSTLGHNWQWRMTADAIDDELTERLKDMTETFFRQRTEAEIFDEAEVAEEYMPD